MSNKPAFSLDDTARAMSEQAKRRGIALSLETCREVVRILFDPADGVIANALVDGQRVRYPGFGAWVPRYKHSSEQGVTISQAGVRARFTVGGPLRQRLLEDA